MDRIPVTVTSAISGDTIWTGSVDAASPVLDLRDLVATALKVPPVAVQLLLNASVLDPKGTLSQKLESGYAKLDHSKVALTAQVDAVKHLAATTFERFMSKVTKEPVACQPELSSSEVADLLGAITSRLGLQELPSEVAAWLELLIVSPKMPGSKIKLGNWDPAEISFEYAKSCEARAFIDARQIATGEGRKRRTQEGLLYFVQVSAGQDDFLLYILDIDGELAKLFGGEGAGGVWFTWLNTEAPSSVSLAVWRKISERHNPCGFGHSANVNFAVLQAPRLVAPGLTAFFEDWAEHGRPPYDEFVLESLRGDSAVISKVAQSSGDRCEVLGIASEDLRADRTLVEEMVGINGAQLKYAAAELRADLAIATKAVQNYPGAFEFASEDLRANKRFVLDAFNTENESGYEPKGMAKFVSKELLDDPEVIEQVLVDVSAFQYMSDAVRANPGWVKKAAEDDRPQAFQWASSELQSDPEFVKQLVDHVTESGSCMPHAVLEFASESVRGNRDFMMPYVDQSAPLGKTFKFLSAELRGDRELVIRFLKTHEYGCLRVRDFSPELRGNREIMLMVLSLWQDGYADDDWVCNALKYASDELRADLTFVLQAVEASPGGGECLEWASEDIRADRDVVMKSLKKDSEKGLNGPSLLYCVDALKADRDFVREAIQYCPRAIQHASKQLQEELKEEVARLKKDEAK